MSQDAQKTWKNIKFSSGDLVFVSLLEFEDTEDYFKNISKYCLHWWFDFEAKDFKNTSTVIASRKKLLLPHFSSEPLMFVHYRGIPLIKINEESLPLVEHRFNFLRYERRVSIVFVMEEKDSPFRLFEKVK